MMLWPNSTVPDGWLLRDGKNYDPNEYPKLFAVLGYNYGKVGNNFCVPNDVNEVFFAASKNNIGSFVQNQNNLTVTIPNTGWDTYANGHGYVSEGGRGCLIGVSARNEIKEYLESIGHVQSSRTFKVDGDIKPSRRLYLPIIKHD